MTLPASLTVAGVTLRRLRCSGPPRYSGQSGRLRFNVVGPSHKCDPAWHGYCAIESDPPSVVSMLLLPSAWERTPESCAATLTEIVRSVAAALGGVA